MTPATEARIRQALDALGDALTEALAGDGADGTPDRLLSVDEAAALLGIGRSRLYSELAAGRLRSVHVGDRRLIPSTAIGEFIRERAA